MAPPSRSRESPGRPARSSSATSLDRPLARTSSSVSLRFWVAVSLTNTVFGPSPTSCVSATAMVARLSNAARCSPNRLRRAASEVACEPLDSTPAMIVPAMHAPIAARYRRTWKEPPGWAETALSPPRQGPGTAGAGRRTNVPPGLGTRVLPALARMLLAGVRLGDGWCGTAHATRGALARMASPTGLELEKQRSPGPPAAPVGGRSGPRRGAPGVRLYRAAPGARPAPIPRTERLLAALLIVAATVVRGLALLRHRVNSDEPQHLHVAWSWTQGLLPYRDVFDNHSPLFSLLMSWPLRALGERPDIVLQMRLFMLPFALGSLVLAAIIARRLFGNRVALWSLVLLGAHTDFLLGSVEYRTDVAWACAWLGALAVLVGGRMSVRRAIAAGLLAGVAQPISMKPSLLVTAAGAAAVLTWFASSNDERPSPARAAALVAAAACGFVVVPSVVVAAFARLGALEPMIRCTVGYNVVPGLGLWGTAPLRPLGFLLGLPVLGALVIWVRRSEAEPGAAGRIALLLAATGFAHLAIETLWPLVVRGDMLPIWPVETILGAAVLTRFLPAAWGARPGVRARLSAAVLALAAIGELALTIRFGDLGHDCSRSQRRALAEILHLTRPGDLVMSVKGEAIFRRRPVYAAIETIAEERYRRGLLADDIAERLAATGTAVVMQYDSRPYPA